MISNDAIRGIDSILVVITELACVRPHACNLLDPREEWNEDICVVIRPCTLDSCDKTFKSHASVNVFGWQGLQRTIIIAVELDENVVPYLYNEGVILINEVGGITATYVVIVNFTE
jgi:hypothetical protein